MTTNVDDIVKVLEKACLRARQTELLTKIFDPDRPRTSFRVELDSGAVIKVRWLESEEVAINHQELRSVLPESFTPVLARIENVLIEPWIQGCPLTETRPTELLVRKAGHLLAEMHRIPQAAGRPLPFSASTLGLRDTTISRLMKLATAGVLETPTVQMLRNILETNVPTDVPHGLVHMDFCGENMVITPDGRLFIVDNERTSIGPLGLDVARTWYRWGLRDQVWDCFLVGYRTARGQSEVLAHELFWRIAAVMISADLRFRSGYSQLDVPLKCLRSLAQSGFSCGETD